MRNVRNFWFEAEVDGRKEVISGGPRSADGGMVIRVFQRNDGEPTLVLCIECLASPHVLRTVVTDVASGNTTILARSRR